MRVESESQHTSLNRPSGCRMHPAAVWTGIGSRRGAVRFMAHDRMSSSLLQQGFDGGEILIEQGRIGIGGE